MGEVLPASVATSDDATLPAHLDDPAESVVIRQAAHARATRRSPAPTTERRAGMNATADLPLVLFVIDDDPALEVRLRRLCSESGRTGRGVRGRGFQFRLSHEFDPRRGAALFIVPAAAVNTILGGRSRLALPVLAYGNDQGLAPAFLRGCVDYLREPWTLTELQLRVQRWLDRRDASATPAASGGGIRLRGTTLHGPGGAVTLSVAQARLLDMLLYNAGRVTSREALFYRLWGRLPAERSRVIDVHIAALRRKCRTAMGGDGAGATGLTITAVRGEGYLLAAARTATRTASPADC